MCTTNCNCGHNIPPPFASNGEDEVKGDSFCSAAAHLSGTAYLSVMVFNYRNSFQFRNGLQFKTYQHVNGKVEADSWMIDPCFEVRRMEEGVNGLKESYIYSFNAFHTYYSGSGRPYFAMVPHSVTASTTSPSLMSYPSPTCGCTVSANLYFVE